MVLQALEDSSTHQAPKISAKPKGDGVFGWGEC